METLALIQDIYNHLILNFVVPLLNNLYSGDKYKIEQFIMENPY